MLLSLGEPGWGMVCVPLLMDAHAFSQVCWWTTVRYTAEPSTPAQLAWQWPLCALLLWDHVKTGCASATMQVKQRQRVTVGKLYKTYLKTFLKWTLGKMSKKFVWKWSQYDLLSYSISRPTGWGGKGGQEAQGSMPYPLSNLHFKGNVYVEHHYQHPIFFFF